MEVAEVAEVEVEVVAEAEAAGEEVAAGEVEVEVEVAEVEAEVVAEVVAEAVAAEAEAAAEVEVAPPFRGSGRPDQAPVGQCCRSSRAAPRRGTEAAGGPHPGFATRRPGWR